MSAIELRPIDIWLRSRPDRCSGCGYHFEKQGCRCEDGEWSLFVAAVKQAARPDGTVHQSDVRPLYRGKVNPKHVGPLYRRARSEGLLVDTGQREPSSDVAGRNTDKLERVYRLVSA